MLNISKKIYAGYKPTIEGDLSDAVIIPVGDSAIEKKKIKTFLSKNKHYKELDNIPLPGFTLCEGTRLKYGSIDPGWRIIDPRGFTVKITSRNLESILLVTGITEGLIQQKCVWAREDSSTTMRLVPQSADLYAEAVLNTDILESKVNIKDVQIGDTVLLQNKIVGIYRGVASVYSSPGGHGLRHIHKVSVGLRKQFIEVAPDKFFFQSDAKILKILKSTSTPMSREDSIAGLLESRISGRGKFAIDAQFYTSNYTTAGINHISISAIPVVELSFQEVDKQTAINLCDAINNDENSLVLLLQDDNNKHYLIDHRPSYSRLSEANLNFRIHTLVEDPFIIPPGGSIVTVDKYKSANHYGRNDRLYHLDNFIKYYKIIKHVKKETYI
jgi:hypothetical protein